MNKNFQLWHGQKQHIQDRHPRVLFKEREIWFCHLGQNIGFEQDGRGESFLRPVLILKKFNNEVCWAVPLTKVRDGRLRAEHLYFSFSFISGTNSAAILSQLRLLDVKRLKYKAGYMATPDFVSLKTKLRRLIA